MQDMIERQAMEIARLENELRTEEIQQINQVIDVIYSFCLIWYNFHFSIGGFIVINFYNIIS